MSARDSLWIKSPHEAERQQRLPVTRSARLAVTALASMLAACTLGPDYSRPDVEVPAAYRSQNASPTPAPSNAEIAGQHWWQALQDPALDTLIAESLTNNQDLLAATARIDEYYGILGTTRSAMFPQVGGEIDGARQRASERTNTGASPRNPFNSVQADVFASWEIDLFGRVRRQTEAARANLLATEEARRGVVLSLTAAVANGYINLRDLDQQLEVAKATLESRLRAFELFDKRYKGGVVSELEYSQARSEYASALAAVPTIEQAIALQENALSVIVGRNPGPIARGKRIDQLIPLAVPSGLPSDLLNRRPDVLQAEQNLVAANANIGAARALYFPSISLTGLFGGASTSLNGLFSGPGRVWSFAANATMPIFTAGNISGQVQAAEARQQQALAQYRKAIQTAFRETDDALIGLQKTQAARDAVFTRVDALRSYSRLARLRYDGGYTSYLEVLDAERSLFSAELQLAQSQADALTQFVNIYKAIGGSWQVSDDEGAPRPAAH
ncbi:efflux transporter outer membrane subunit [Uliginosibacterium sp. H3]|uniref:Efflux transporter outer membrane subunit n=1 Tax=Uliginosibacterium silvisoli TaxID=3114758 RepID=A0ABU6K3R0_9RHOO|nr:efflux transporter outer membrane subunit [Uliginosibacterium sp. H3]